MSSPKKKTARVCPASCVLCFVFCVGGFVFCVCFKFADLDIPTYKSSAQQLQTSLNDVDLSDLTSQTVRKTPFWGSHFMLKNDHLTKTSSGQT